MWRRVGKIILIVIMWSMVVAYIVYASVITVRHRRMQSIERVDINILDGGEMGQLVTSHKVREWILRSGIATIGVQVDAVDVDGIRKTIERNGFVDDVDVYVSYGGVLSIDISQRRPMMRLITEGYNVYITEEGFVFGAPESSALYVPIVTGTYKPIVEPKYEGMVCDYVAAHAAEAEERIRIIGREKSALLKEELRLKHERDSVCRIQIKRNWLKGESNRDFIARKEKLQQERTKRRKYYNGLIRDVQRNVAAVEARQQTIRNEQKKLEEKYDDFMKLITFVSRINDDGFWGSEVVQIVAAPNSSGRIELELIPRSGDFRIIFGEIEEVEQRLDKLMKFYCDGLGNLGWDRYSKINVKYNNQVVCTE